MENIGNEHDFMTPKKYAEIREVTRLDHDNINSFRMYCNQYDALAPSNSSFNLQIRTFAPNCTHCEASIIPDSNSEYPVKYCSECGQELLQPFLCLFCGCPIGAESKYCTGCGIIAIRGDK